MIALYVLDIPENAGIAQLVGQDPTLEVGRAGPYFEITSAGSIVVDREACGCRHAVWYSAVAGVTGGKIVQHDKATLRAEPW